MKQSEFRAEWERLIANVEQGKLSDAHMASRGGEAWRLFQHYSAKRFEQAITACITDPERRFFPTVGEIQGYLNDTEPPPNNDQVLEDPETVAQLEEENRKWWLEEILPVVEGKMRMDDDGKEADENE